MNLRSYDGVTTMALDVNTQNERSVLNAIMSHIPGPGAFLKYVHDIRYFIYVIVMVFAVFTIFGYLIAVASPDVTNAVISTFEEQVSPLKELSPIGLMLGIFLNNAEKCLMVMLLGVVFGIVPLVFIIANGLIIGIVVGATLAETSLLYVLVGIVPHGIVEMPMVFISAAIGLKLGYSVIMALLRRNVDILKDIKDALLIFFFWIMPLLLLSAFIETFVTATLLYILFNGSGMA